MNYIEKNIETVVFIIIVALGAGLIATYSHESTRIDQLEKQNKQWEEAAAGATLSQDSNERVQSPDQLVSAIYQYRMVTNPQKHVSGSPSGSHHR